jgi:Zn finger protein HypA/HybF involved in hydrogenase expression
LFDAIKGDAGFGGAELVIEEEPVALQCKQCLAEFTVDEPVFRCPQCTSGDVQIRAGRGIMLTRIGITDRTGRIV